MKKFIRFLFIAIVLVIFVVLLINFYVIGTTKKQIIKQDAYLLLKDVDCILILGAGVRGNEPSPILKDRLLEGIKLYKENVASKIIMSGDHSTENYDEVNIMKNFAIENGVPAEDIFMDHAGFSTYESVYRAKEIFMADSIVIVTQEYHLYRALYIANQLDITAYGVNSDLRKYRGQTYRELREILARNKDFVLSIFKPEPTYLGPVIPVSGDGNATNDK